MALQTDFEIHLERFKNTLEPSDLEDFRSTTFDKLKRSISNIQSEQSSERRLVDLSRIGPFLDSAKRYGEIIETLSQNAEILAYLWTTSKNTLAFNEILIAYQKIGNCLAIISDVGATSLDRPQLQTIISDVYQNIQQFHALVLEYFRYPRWEECFTQTWERRKDRFTNQINKIAQDQSLIVGLIGASRIEETRLQIQEGQQETENRFNEEELRQERTVHEWLKASDVEVDHHNLCQLREQYPDSGRWLLQNTTFSQWFDQRFPPIPPLLWINGIPGAGKVHEFQAPKIYY
ncbi:unnamed protein product [Clonostachys rosea]|uniref:Nephrocystin 3-like N-terminal domain-containing protein n=1 Tax=Bionectria ochroleuca TaxID=29856 RepID=A0ABY6TWC4_BIOOC|nr:unnamed protein product [Clonostachys rosea]